MEALNGNEKALNGNEKALGAVYIGGVYLLKGNG